MTHHYTYGGSTIERTFNCEAWAYLAKSQPKADAGYPAKLGTALHAVFERCIKEPDWEPEPGVYEGIEVTEEHILNKIFPALDAANELAEKYGIDAWESEISGKLADDVGGTADLVGIGSIEGEKVLVVPDLKTGDGHLVYAQDNGQNMFYAACMREKDYNKYGRPKRVVIAIIQPTERKEDPLDTAEYTAKEIQRFKTKVMKSVKAAKNAEKKGLQPIPDNIGDHCKYCPVLPVCPAHEEMTTDITTSPLPRTQEVNQSELDNLDYALKRVHAIEMWITGIKARATSLLESGVALPNFKLVSGRRTRFWSDPDGVYDLLKKSGPDFVDEFYDTKMKTPAQAEKVCKERDLSFDEFTAHIDYKPPGKLLVSAKDKRDALEATPEEIANYAKKLNGG